MKTKHNPVFNKFLSKDRVDTFVFGQNNTRCFRATINKFDPDTRKILYSKPKEMKCFTKISLDDPFSKDIYKNYEKTNIQKNIEIFAKKMNYFGNLAISCPCGGGKTLAGVILMSKLGLQTLIISTRCAINDQWRDTLLKTYKSDIKILTREGLFTWNNKKDKMINYSKAYVAKHNIIPDVYIYSPQYLHSKIEKFPNTVGLVIYDEIHSQMSDEYSKVLIYPYKNVIDNKIEELPYMIALSATYPSRSSIEYATIEKIFGEPVVSKSTITDIPIYVKDARNDYKKESNTELDIFDKFYNPMDDYEFINNVINGDNNFFNENIQPTILNNNDLCGFIITSTIKSSVYTWLKIYNKYKNKKCCLIRENVDGCYVLTGDVPADIIRLGKLVDLDDIVKHKDFDKFCVKAESFYNNDILIGTYQRLKEGISVPNAVWGICTKFVWSITTRIQILGRIRRMTNNDKINNHKRYFLVNSCKVPTNLGAILMSKKKHYKNKPELKVEYDMDEEKILFDKENYIMV